MGDRSAHRGGMGASSAARDRAGGASEGSDISISLRSALPPHQAGRRSMVVRAESTEFDSEKLIKDLSEKVRGGERRESGGEGERCGGVGVRGLPRAPAAPTAARGLPRRLSVASKGQLVIGAAGH